MPKPNKPRLTSHREIKKWGIQLPNCKCQRQLKGQLSQRRRMCQRCFLRSPDGKHRQWLRVNLIRDRDVFLESVLEWREWKVRDNAIAPDRSVGIVIAINTYINGSVEAEVEFYPNLENEKFAGILEDSFLISSNYSLIKKFYK